MAIVKYECINPIMLEKYDDNGFPTNRPLVIKKGEKFECDTECQKRLVGSYHETLRLSNKEHWIEITKENLRTNFVEVE